jgi:type II secretory pathway pseudopilin PulG
VLLTRIAAAVFLVLSVLLTFLTVGLVGMSTEADERSQAADAAARESARQTARAQAFVARIENDNARYFEAASAALAGLTNPLTLDTDPDQVAPWRELTRAVTADNFLTPPLQHQDMVRAAAFDPTGERVVTASADQTARIWSAPPTGQILLDQVRSKLGRHAPQPLRIPDTTERSQGYLGAISKGLSIIWAETTRLLGAT